MVCDWMMFSTWSRGRSVRSPVSQRYDTYLRLYVLLNQGVQRLVAGRGRKLELRSQLRERREPAVEGRFGGLRRVAAGRPGLIFEELNRSVEACSRAAALAVAYDNDCKRQRRESVGIASSGR